MNYQNYEEYMRQVLGYNPYPNNPNTYFENQDMNNYYIPNTNVSRNDLNEYYPEIYKIIYPMVCRVCNINFGNEFTKELLEQMVDEVYRNVEPEEIQNVRSSQPPLKNGDVRNPNVKVEVTKEVRGPNYLLRDLIKILLLREWVNSRPPYRPPMGGPNNPGNRPRYY